MIHYASIGERSVLDLNIILYALSRSVIIVWYNVFLVKFITANVRLSNTYKVQKSLVINYFAIYIFYVEFTFLLMLADRFVKSLKNPSTNEILPKFLQKWLKK
jgi:hypothetical protein